MNLMINYKKYIIIYTTLIFILLSLLSKVFCEKCEIPEIDLEKVEVVCFNWKQLTTGVIDNGDGTYKSAATPALLVDTCAKSAGGILLRCKIGYQNKKSKDDDEFLNICRGGKWKFDKNDSDDCESICGKLFKEKPKSTPKPLLYKGNETDIELASWHVAIYRNSSNNFEQICGGTIIHSNVVVSAGHCFYDESFDKTYDPSNFLIGAGKRFRQYEANELLAQFAHIKKIHLPPTFQAQPLRSDIAVLVLDRHFKYSPAIAPVCLEWDLTSLHFGTHHLSASLYGWGDTSSKGVPSSKLLKIPLVTIDNADCKNMIDPNYRSDITADRFCAINKDNATACGGDSGGGLITFRQGHKLTGIVSVGINRDRYCSDGFVTLFTDVRVFSDFLKLVISDSRNKEQEVVKNLLMLL